MLSCFWMYILDVYCPFISQLYANRYFVSISVWRMIVLSQIEDKDRKKLEAKLAVVFQEKISRLSTELREILLDDMVTAFENRLNVLNNVCIEDSDCQPA